jgi:hypothetical protein
MTRSQIIVTKPGRIERTPNGFKLVGWSVNIQDLSYDEFSQSDLLDVVIGFINDQLVPAAHTPAADEREAELLTYITINRAQDGD